ncbi:MAG: MurR/RpiR family transcriptional regulator [Kiloniellaceae bacterium]
MKLKENSFTFPAMRQVITDSNGGSAPEPFDALRERIRDRYDELSPHLQRIARLALDEPNQFALQTIAAIAERLKIQPSTVIRFAKEFGYDGFSGMQQVFKLRLIEGGALHRARVYEASHTESRTGAPNSLDACIDTLIASLEALRREVSPEQLAQAVRLCAGARHIYVAGQRRSHPIATYVAYGLNRLERRCSLLDFAGGMAAQQVANMGHEDLLIAIAFTPYTAMVVDIVRDASLRGLPILVLTDTPSSPLAANASLAFFVDNESGGQFRPISGAIGLVQAIIVGLSASLEHAG